MKHKIISILFLLSLSSALMAQRIEVLQQGNPSSIRGLSVVDDHTAWVSGSKGTVAITDDGGKTWNWQQVKGFEKADFRDIEAFSDKDAVIMSSGTPALILKTTDGGANWKVKYNNADTAYFFDAMDFADKNHGYVLGDPIKGKFVLMETKDGGETWNEYDNLPVALPNEAAFAASGTCLRVVPLTTNLIISTGGHSAEIDIPKPNGGWNHHQIPVLSGQLSQGAFSVAVNGSKMIVVGGDYQHDKRTDSTACYSNDNGLTWNISNTPPAGFQSCVEHISNNTFLATGTPGSNITTDGGKTWAKIDGASYNVCRKAKNGKLVLLAGNKGIIGIFKP